MQRLLYSQQQQQQQQQGERRAGCYCIRCSRERQRSAAVYIQKERHINSTQQHYALLVGFFTLHSCCCCCYCSSAVAARRAPQDKLLHAAMQVEGRRCCNFTVRSCLYTPQAACTLNELPVHPTSCLYTPQAACRPKALPVLKGCLVLPAAHCGHPLTASNRISLCCSSSECSS